MKTHIVVYILSSTIFFSHASCIAADLMLEPFQYYENFEEGEENAWASYPLWQDTAYDPLFKVGRIVPGDGNISIDQTVETYTNVDSYAGAQKLLDMFLTPQSTVQFRYFIKSHLPSEYLSVHIAAGSDGKIEFKIPSPPVNSWQWVTLSYFDLTSQNANLAGKDRIKANALAVLTKIPDADPDMVFHFGIDDVKVAGFRPVQFQFNEPEMFKLSEWKYYYSQKHFVIGESFTINGHWPVPADRVRVRIVSFSDDSKEFLNKPLSKKGDVWSLKPFRISFPEGMYLAKIDGYKNNEKLSESEFTFLVIPDNISGKHPRLLFDSTGLEQIQNKLNTDKYKNVLENITNTAGSYRKNHPLESIIYDYDQFNDVNLLIDWDAWNGRASAWGSGIKYNALAFALTGDRAAAEYAVASMLKQCSFPNYSHPWMRQRGRYAYWENSYVDGFALGYDLLYDFMDDITRKTIRKGIMKNIVWGSFETFVKDNAVTSNMSNWIPHIAGNPLLNLIAIYGDDVGDGYIEPYLTGHIYKIFAFVQKSAVPGAYGEGFSYYNYTMRGLSDLLPSLQRVFNIDFYAELDSTYNEAIWAGIIKDKTTFYFGDSGSGLGPLTNFAWLLDRNNDPLLGWVYNFLKDGETFEDVLYDTENVPKDDPFEKNPVRLFREIGTTVFKSGWEKDDFVFVMRTGPFFNHQHYDQGTFWLADRGNIFIEERHGSTYDDTPYYRPWYTKPVAHSTILIDRNHQSQRGGDPLDFADGFRDHAFVGHFLDGTDVSFVSGDIGRLYWGKVKEIQRNVLYLKPRTVLMLDVIVPEKRDRDVTLLYQTTYLKDIHAGTDESTITKDGNTLHILHLFPKHKEVKTVKTPHYYHTLRNTKPLIQEGMLTVTARTSGEPLVMANILTSNLDNKSDILIEEGNGYVTGSVRGKEFIFSTKPNAFYTVNDIVTDALVFSLEGSRKFLAMSTVFRIDGELVLKSEKPVTCELYPEGMKYYLSERSEVTIGTGTILHSVIINGKKMKETRYDSVQRAVIVTLPPGEGVVSFQ